MSAGKIRPFIEEEEVEADEEEGLCEFCLTEEHDPFWNEEAEWDFLICVSCQGELLEDLAKVAALRKKKGH